MNIGSILRRERKRKKLSIKKLASIIGIDYSYVSKFESNKAMPSEELITKLCALYNLDTKEMLIRTGRLPDDIKAVISEHPFEACNLLKNKFRNRISDPHSPTVFCVSPRKRGRCQKSRLPIISLFTGAGGLDIGLERTGFEVKVCIDNDKDCWKTIELNTSWPIMKNHDGDLKKIKSEEILAFANLREGEAALVVGGAPCQPFSNIGKRKGVQDTRDGSLFQEFVRVVKGTRPAGFIFENVSGLLQKKHEIVIEYMLTELSNIGYAVSYALVNASDYGVPQRRKRVFFLGRRDNIKPGFPFPTHSEDPKRFCALFSEYGTKLPWELQNWITVADAFYSIDENLLGSSNCLSMNISDKVKERMTYIAGNMNFKNLPDHLKPRCWKTGRHQGADTFGRLQPDRPSVTIRTCAYNPSKGRYIHPYDNRGLNTVELALLQSFPAHWKFYGSLVSVGRQIGNAVPPKLGEAFGLVMYEQVCEVLNL